MPRNAVFPNATASDPRIAIADISSTSFVGLFFFGGFRFFPFRMLELGEEAAARTALPRIKRHVQRIVSVRTRKTDCARLFVISIAVVAATP